MSTCRNVSAVLGLLLAANAAHAASWFFRPDNAVGYGLGNGRSYADAWHLDDRSAAPGHVDWSLVKPGDRVFICGFHRSGRDVALRPTVSGTAAAPIIIDGNCPATAGEDPGVMLLAGAEITGGWQAAGHGAWVQFYEGSSASQLVEDTDGLINGVTGLQRLARRSGAPTAAWPCGSFSQYGSSLYYKPSDADRNGACDAPRRVYTQGNDAILFAGVSHFLLRNLVLWLHDRVIGLDAAQGIAIEGNDIRWASAAGIRARRSSDGGRISGNHIHDVLSGIYMENQVDWNNADNMDGWVIADNEIHDVDQDCYYACQAAAGVTADTHAIAFQGGTGNRVERNHVHHVGGEGILFYAMRGQVLADNVVQHNFVHHVKDLNADTAGHPERNERGIEHGGSNEEPVDQSVNNLIRYNVVTDVDQVAIRVKASRPASGYSWSVLNNVIARAGRSSFAFTGRTDTTAQPAARPGFRFRNNISVSPGYRHLEQLGTLAADASGISVLANLFHPDDVPGVFRYDWGASAYESIAGWSGAAGRAGGSGGDPRFMAGADFGWLGVPAVIPGGGEFRLQGSSPAINAGSSLSAAGDADLNGDPVLVLRDIGAYEAPTDVQLVAPAWPDLAVSPGNAVYRFTVRNAGPAPASGVAFADAIPTGTLLVAAVPSQGNCGGSTLVQCDLGSLAWDASATVTLTVKGAGSPQILSGASVSAREFDPQIGNNTAAVASQSAAGGCHH